jgi:predicted anti-sigma-YlaC factor YlaD
MLIPVPPSECMRAREAASVRLDGELSELDALRLDAHLRRCAACREFADHATAVTAELRAAPLQRPAALRFEPSRRHARALRMHAATAAAAAVVIAGSLLVGVAVRGAGGPSSTGALRPSAAEVRLASVDRWREMLSLLPPGDRELIDLHVARWAA